MKISRYKIDIVLSVILVFVLVLNWYHHLNPLFVLFIAILGALPVFFSAWSSFKEKEWASMDLLASFALIFSIVSHAFASAIFIELMLASARILADITKENAEKSIRGLLKLRPSFVMVEKNGRLEEKYIKDIHVGDIIEVAVGQRIPVDGLIISGFASIDESSLTGESLPVDKIKGNRAMSSTLVQSGSIKIQATHIGKNTTLERIIRLVEEAKSEKPLSQTMGETFGKAYLISVFILSVILLILTKNILFILSVVLVVCADDVAVAIPIGYLRAIRSAAKHGVIIKGAKHLEMVSQIKTAVFDKTGTLTKGSLSVVAIKTANDYKEKDILLMAALCAQVSHHPVSKAILLHAKKENIKEKSPKSSEELSGKGVIVKALNKKIILGKKILLEEMRIKIPAALEREEQQYEKNGNAISYVAVNDKAIGLIALSDQIRPNAEKMIATIRKLGIERIIMITGDNDEVAKAMKEKLGIDEYYANLLPEDKVNIIRKLQKKSPIVMVGDGINDAGALAIASVGIAMGGLGAEGTIETAQIVFMRDNLMALPLLIKLSRFARKVAWQDFVIWGLTNAMGLSLVFTGTIGPTGAAAYNFISDFFPIFNSLRVRVKEKRIR